MISGGVTEFATQTDHGPDDREGHALFNQIADEATAFDLQTNDKTDDEADDERERHPQHEAHPVGD